VHVACIAEQSQAHCSADDEKKGATDSSDCHGLKTPACRILLRSDVLGRLLGPLCHPKPTPHHASNYSYPKKKATSAASRSYLAICGGGHVHVRDGGKPVTPFFMRILATPFRTMPDLSLGLTLLPQGGLDRRPRHLASSSWPIDALCREADCSAKPPVSGIGASPPLATPCLFKTRHPPMCG
jgi:hypothetical protein